jgi:hypothetical protein
VTEHLRQAAAQMFRQLLDSGMHRKRAVLEVKEWVRGKDPDQPCSRSSIYAWCAKFGISTL